MEDEVLNRELNIPLHYQLMVLLKKRIIDGFYPVDSKIPNEMELCDEFKVSRPTVRKAVAVLVDAGLLVKIHPKGTFVRKHDKEESDIPEIRSQASLSISDDILNVSLESPLMDFYLNQAVEEFEQQTGTKINIQLKGSWQEGIYSVVNTIIENQLPDIFLVSNMAVPAFAQMGIISPFDPFLKKEECRRLKLAEQAAYGHYLYNDMVYGYPFFSETRLMYYRKDHFDEVHLPYPSPDWTHDDFLALCKKLTHPEKKRWAYAFPISSDGDTLQTLMTWIMQRGGKIYEMRDGHVEMTAEDPEFTEAFKWMCDLVLKYQVCPPAEFSGSYSKICTQFLAGDISMMIGLPSFVMTLDGRLDDKWGIVSLPHGKAHNHGYRGGMPLCISAQCKNRPLAWSFIRYLTSRSILFPYTKRVGVFPAIELYSKDEILSNTSPVLRPFVEALPDSIGWDRSFVTPSEGINMESWQMPIQHALKRVLQGKLSAEYAVKYINLAVRNILKKGN